MEKEEDEPDNLMTVIFGSDGINFCDISDPNKVYQTGNATNGGMANFFLNPFNGVPTGLSRKLHNDSILRVLTDEEGEITYIVEYHQKINIPGAVGYSRANRLFNTKGGNIRGPLVRKLTYEMESRNPVILDNTDSYRGQESQ